ncbi:MAG: hypothetical protein LBT02_03975 [Rickettsiales bacterium]|jgi:hypothetical protein|nr:hypothetical protein [Rickettsiales bacterium]
MKCNLIVAGKTKKNYKGSSNFFLDNRYIPCDEVTAYFKSCDIVILPYDDTSVNTGVGTLSFQNCKTILSSSNVASLKDLKCKDFFTFSMVGKEILMGGEKKKTNEKNFMKAVDNIITKYDKFSLSKLGKNMRNEVKDNTTNFINGLKKLYS